MKEFADYQSLYGSKNLNQILEKLRSEYTMTNRIEFIAEQIKEVNPDIISIKSLYIDFQEIAQLVKKAINEEDLLAVCNWMVNTNQKF